MYWFLVSLIKTLYNCAGLEGIKMNDIVLDHVKAILLRMIKARRIRAKMFRKRTI